MTSATTADSGQSANVSDLLRAAATKFADRPALIESGRTRSWAELDRAVDTGTVDLAAAGLHPGDRVIVSMATGGDIICALFAVARAGLCAVPIGPTRTELDDIVAKVTPRGIIGSQQPRGVDVLIGPDRVAGWWGIDDQVRITSSGGGEDIAVLARAASAQRPVMVSHRAVLAAVSAILAAPSLELRAEDRAILVLPTYHLAGWVTAFLPLCLVGGAAVIPDPPTAETSWVDAVLASVRGQRVSVVPGAPSLYRRLRAAEGLERALASVRLMTSGAAPLDPGDFSAIRATTGLTVWEGYGISESSSVVSTSLMTAAARTGSVGLPLPGLALRIVGDDGADLYAERTDEGAAAPEVDSAALAADAGSGGEVGRVQITGSTLFSGYWPDGSGGAGDEGWFSTGDLGYFDELGELHLVDRAAETIRIAGFTVYPREIEDVLVGHPYVRDAAVIGAPGRAGEQVVAVLVPMWGTHPTPADLEDFVAARLPVFKRPQRYQLVDRLPRNEIGRIDRDAVRAAYHAGDADLAGSDGVEPAEVAAEVFAPVLDGPPSVDGDPIDASRAEPSKDADVRPEPAAPLEELGSRLPRTGLRDRRGDDDTDDDLF